MECQCENCTSHLVLLCTICIHDIVNAQPTWSSGLSREKDIGRKPKTLLAENADGMSLRGA